MNGRALWHLMLADWRERTRRPTYWVSLAAMLVMAYGFLPNADAGYRTVDIGGHSGIYNSAWVGGTITLMTGCFMPLIGFYLIKNALARDEDSGVGAILAATGMSNRSYLFGKFLSNWLVLASLVSLIMVGGVVMQFWRGESRELDLAALFLPQYALNLPIMALVAALGVLFECVRWLRGGLGNVLFFFVWIGSLSTDTSSQGEIFGMNQITDSMQAAVRANYPGSKGEISIGINILDAKDRERPAPEPIVWEGLSFTPAMLAQRAGVAALALPFLFLAGLFFRRFDGTAASGRTGRRFGKPAMEVRPEAAGALSVGAEPHLPGLSPLAPAGGGLGRRTLTMTRAEFKMLWRSLPLWLLFAILGLNIAATFVPAQALSDGIIPVLWLLPVLAWSQLGARAAVHDTEPLLFSAAHPLRRGLSAAWLAGVVLALVTAAAPLVRALLTGEFLSALGLLAGAAFIPALALGCGLITRGPKLFQVVYCGFWYAGLLQHVPGLDFAGLVPANRMPLTWALAAASLLALGVGWQARRLARR